MPPNTIAVETKKKLDERNAEAQRLYKEFTDARDEAVADGKDLAGDRELFDAIHEKHKTYAVVADEVASLQDQLVKALGWDNAPPDEDRKEIDRDDPASKLWTPGGRVVESDAYKGFVAENEGKLLSGAKTRNVEMPAIEYASRDEFKALLTGLSRTSAGAFISPDRQADLLSLLLRPLTVRNLVTVGDTDSDIVEYVRETLFTNAAAETAEATATAGTSGTKPESELRYDVIQHTVKTIAHWIPATKRALADVGQLRTLIDTRLTDGVNLRLDSQMINGDATGENLRGIFNTSNVLTQSAVGNPGVEAILRAMTQIRVGFLEPNAVLMHPNDFVDVRLSKNVSGDYYYGPPNIVGPMQVWGLPITLSTVVPEGTALVGKWDEAILWVREGVTITATDSHNDFFIRNMVAILAEGRFAFAVPRPSAFCIVTGL